MNRPQILVVEDDPAVRNLITTTLETQDYQFHTAQNGGQAIMEAVSGNPDVILLDLARVAGYGRNRDHQKGAFLVTGSDHCDQCQRRGKR